MYFFEDEWREPTRKHTETEPGEIAQWSREHTAFAEDPVS